ncbi:battenin-like [Patiria miniata]|uniref:Battenin n=1 Tax=Patiria miniata TaxID=46514 RepID=A0A914A0Q4_PATMI|nr:battenin-like [Patiria miniata]
MPYGARFFANSVIMLSGISGLAFSKSFALAILSIVLVGASNAFGENVALGYLSRFDSHNVTAWASGYGLAGLLGAFLYVLFGCFINGEEHSQDMRNLDKWAFISIVPAVVVYLAVSLRLIKERAKPAKQRQICNRSSVDDQTTPLLINTTDILRVQREVLSETSSHSQSSSQSSRDALLTTDKDEEIVLPLSAKIKEFFLQIRRCFRLVAWLAFNLAVVQFSSYTIRVAAAKARPKHDTASCPELYASLQLCFQAGVFASQSSLPILKIRRVGLLTAVLTINMLLWLINEGFKFLPVALLPALMVVVV